MSSFWNPTNAAPQGSPPPSSPAAVPSPFGAAVDVATQAVQPAQAQPLPWQGQHQAAPAQHVQPQPQPGAAMRGAPAANPYGSANVDALAAMVGGATPTKRGIKLTDGMYPLLQIQACRIQQSQQVQGAQYFILEAQILESQVPERGRGLEVCWTANLTQHAPAAGNVRDMIAKALNKQVEEIDEAVFRDVIGPRNLLAGRLIGCTVQTITTRGGRPFPVHTFASIAEQHQQNAMQIRQQLLGA